MRVVIFNFKDLNIYELLKCKLNMNDYCSYFWIGLFLKKKVIIKINFKFIRKFLIIDMCYNKNIFIWIILFEF